MNLTELRYIFLFGLKYLLITNCWVRSFEYTQTSCETILFIKNKIVNNG